MATINLGKIKFVHRGEYSASATYTQDDIVSYNNKTFIFINTSSATNQAPLTSDSSWSKSGVTKYALNSAYWDYFTEGLRPIENTANGVFIMTDGFQNIYYSNNNFTGVNSKFSPFIANNITTLYPSNSPRNLLATGNNTVVLASAANGVYFQTSTDGYNWTKRTSGANNLPMYSLTYGNGVFVAVGGNATSAAIQRSTDNGATWTNITPANTHPLYCVTYGNGVFVAVGGNATVSSIQSSVDNGVTWTNRTNTMSALTPITAVGYGNGVFVAVANSATAVNSVSTSSDGLSWTNTAPTVATSNVYSVAYSNNTFVMVSSVLGAANNIFYSTNNGVGKWSNSSYTVTGAPGVTTSKPMHAPYSIVVSNNIFYMTTYIQSGYSTANTPYMSGVLSSNDGVTFYTSYVEPQSYSQNGSSTSSAFTNFTYLTPSSTTNLGWSATTTYYVGDIVNRANNAFICLRQHSNDDPMVNVYNSWDVFLDGETIPMERTVAFLENDNPVNWSGHPYITKPYWNSNTATTWNGNVPTNPYLPPVAKKPEYNGGKTGYTRVYGGATFAGWNTFVSVSGNGSDTSVYNYNVGQSPGRYVGDRNFLHKDITDEYILSKSDLNSRSYTNVNPYTTLERISQLENLSSASILPKAIQIQPTGHAGHAILFNNGTVAVIGQNDYYQYGENHTTTYNPSVHLGRETFGGKRIVKLACGGDTNANHNHTLALDEEGNIWSWGYNGYGQCGVGPDSIASGVGGIIYNTNTTDVRSPTKLNYASFFGNNPIVDIWAAGGNYGWSAALDSAGNLWTWGYNGVGQLGYSTASGFSATTYSTVPQKVNVNWNTYNGIQKVCIVGVGNVGAMFVLDGQGSVWNCGYNGQGWLGDGTTTDTGSSGTITKRIWSQLTTATGLNGEVVVNMWASPHYSNCSIFLRTTSGFVFGIGFNASGQLSVSGTNTTNQTSPVLIKNVYNPAKIAFAGWNGGQTIMALLDNGEVYSGGWNYHGEAGQGSIAGSNSNANANRVQERLSASYGWHRVMVPSWHHRNIIDITGYGEYYAGDYTAQFFLLTKDHEMLFTGSNGQAGNNVAFDVTTIHHGTAMSQNYWGG